MIRYDSYTDKFINYDLETEAPCFTSDKTAQTENGSKILEMGESGKTVNLLEEQVEELTRRVEALEKKLERVSIGFPLF